MKLQYATSAVINNSISDNDRSGIYYIGCNPVLKNNIVSHNDDYGIYCFMSGNAAVSFSDVWGNDLGNYQGMPDCTDSAGNISHDPLYGYLDGGNLRLQLNSPCIDSGDTADSVPPGGGDRIDIGAIEYTCADTICGDANRDCLIDQGDVDYLGAYLDMGQQGPPPDPLCVGDANCDGTVGIGDIIYLQNYLNGTGPAPCDTCCAQ